MSYNIHAVHHSSDRGHWYYNTAPNCKWTREVTEAVRYRNLAEAQEQLRVLHFESPEFKRCWKTDITEFPETDKSVLFHEYRVLALSVAARFSRFYGDVSELEDMTISHLGTLITELWEEYDPGRSRRTTWIYNSIYYFLQKVAAQKVRHHAQHLEETLYPNRTWDSIDDLVRDMSPWARYIVDLIRVDPDGVSQRFKLPGDHRLFQEYLVMEHGLTWNQCHKAWAELETIFREAK